MLDFRKNRIGFSTGALDRGNYRQALRWLRNHFVHNVELSALRLEELEPLITDLQSLPLRSFKYVSFHAPSAFPANLEQKVVKQLNRVAKHGWNIIVHPDVIRQPALWRGFGRKLLLENMDRRKAVARTADELAYFFHELPEARLCLDVAHARQLDTTLTVLTEIIHKFRSKLAEIHISELDSNCVHQLMSYTSVTDYRQLSSHINYRLPVIIESALEGVATELRMNELHSADYAMGGPAQRRLKSSTVFFFKFDRTFPRSNRISLRKHQSNKRRSQSRAKKVSNSLQRRSNLRRTH